MVFQRKKAHLKEHIFKDPEKCSCVIERYRKSEVAKYDLNNYVEYFAATLIKTMQGAESSKREKIVQRLIHLGSKNYISVNDLDISFEPDAGRGPVDFKVSCGGDKTIVEIKLSTNTQYLHG